MRENTDRFFVLTGGPGSGKSTLVQALQAAGYSGSIEAGRSVIQDQVTVGGRALPWDDRLLFAEMMLSCDIRSYRTAEEARGSVFFDRGVIDVLGYLRLIGLHATPYMRKAAETFRYNRRVLVAPPWEEIFTRDQERKQNFDEAVETHRALQSVYQEYGYELVEVPRAPVAGRVRFVLDAIGAIPEA